MFRENSTEFIGYSKIWKLNVDKFLHAYMVVLSHQILFYRHKYFTLNCVQNHIKHLRPLNWSRHFNVIVPDLSKLLLILGNIGALVKHNIQFIIRNNVRWSPIIIFIRIKIDIVPLNSFLKEIKWSSLHKK